MKNTLTIYIHRLVPALATLSIVAIAANMYFVYMATHNNTIAWDIEKDIQTLQIEIMAASGHSVTMWRDTDLTATHLVIAEPVTVSVSQ